MFLYFAPFFAVRGERVKTLSTPSLPKHQQRLFPFVLSLSKYERTL
ncbi:MAG: hypothetical protein LBD67_02020 [Candidatus Accumulibacter sp.]|nr:hypothetical protein [Accumulibacter sp.]